MIGILSCLWLNFAEPQVDSLSGPHFVSRDSREAGLYARFLTSKGITALITYGAIMSVESSGVSQGALLTASEEFKLRFGIDLFRRRSDSALIKPFFASSWSSTTPISFSDGLKRFSDTCLMKSMLAGMLKMSGFNISWRLRGWRYMLRPWLSEQLRLTEAVEGHVDIIAKGAPEVIVFFFSPKDQLNAYWLMHPDAWRGNFMEGEAGSLGY